MDFVTGLFLGGVSRGVIRDIDRATRAATGVVTDNALAEQNRVLYELAIQWQAYAERLEAENAQLRADVAAVRSRQPGA